MEMPDGLLQVWSLVTDGQMDVSGVAPYRGRLGRWHVPRTVRFRLYDDNLTGERNEELTDSIRGVAMRITPTAMQRWSS